MTMRFSAGLPHFALALSLAVSACATPAVAPSTPASPGQPAVGAAPATSPSYSSSRRDAKLEGPAPDTLIGRDQNGILKLVGAPGLIRHEKGVDVWQYADDSCTLLLYFYDDKQTGARKLTYLEALSKGTAATSPAACLSAQIHAFKAKDLG